MTPDRKLTVFTWDHRFGEWRLSTRRDGSPLVTAWPAVHVVLEQGTPRLVVPPSGEPRP